MEPLEDLIKCLEQGRRGALATIVSRKGATPRDAGAKVFIGEDGSLHGTVGGGCMEAEVWHHARLVMKSGEPKMLRYSLNGQTVEDEGMICGGTVEIFIEPVTEKQAEIYKGILSCLEDGEKVFVVTKLNGPPLEKSLFVGSPAQIGRTVPPLMEENMEKLFHQKSPLVHKGYLLETLEPFPHLFIYGAGHISQYISRMAKMVDFHVTVVDDRAHFANRERFPEADEVLVEDFGEIFKEQTPMKNGYAVIVTRGHKHDAVVLEKVLKEPPRYVGMIGSKRKIKIIYDDLRGKGFDEGSLNAVHAPIGIDIDAETPQEIAVSIVAELIKVRSAGR